jgi:cytochrome b involved in lipid metabolism
MSKTFSAADVGSHNKPDSLYIIVDEDVYDLTSFQDEHPGMLESILSELTLTRCRRKEE